MEKFIRNSTTANFKSLILSGFVLLCVLGIQFSGIVHEISHDSSLKISVSSSINEGSVPSISDNPSFGHDSSSKFCKLFDGLALSVVVIGFLFALSLFNQFTEQYKESKTFAIRQFLICPYSSRAPPNSIY
jgi:hypothetical protein